MGYFNKAMLVASAALCLNLSVFSQDITLKTGNVTVKEAMEQLKKSSGYSFVFSSVDVDTQKRVSVSVQNASIEEAVKQILQGQESISYEIQDKRIILKKDSIVTVASTLTVKGKVVDVKGEPVIGASVIEKGSTSNGIITDMDGNFFLEVKKGAIIEISYIGYKTKDVRVNTTQLSIVIEEDNKMLEEVVVIGYGTMKKKDLTGAISHVETDKFIKENPISMMDMLRSAIPGLNIPASNSAAGTNSGIQIRGQRSLGADNQPLVVLNGAIFQGDLSEINPSDIASVDVLKDASSAAIYGAKSANGVIIISTKKGTSEKPTVKLDVSAGFVTMGVNRKVYDEGNYLRYRSDYASSLNGAASDYNNWGYYQEPTSENLAKYGLTLEQWRNYDSLGENGDSDTDIWLKRINLGSKEIENYHAGRNYNWYDASFQTGLRQNYNVSLSGRTERVNYYFSLGALDSEGVVVGDKFRNYRSNLNLEGKVNSFLEAGLNFNFQNRVYGYASVDWGGQLRNSPFSTPTLEDGTWDPYPMGQNNHAAGTNSFYNISMQSQDKSVHTLTASVYAKIKLPFNISYQFTYSPRYSWQQERTWNSSERVGNTDNGVVWRYNANSLDWTIDNMLKWNYTFNSLHQVDLTLLQSAECYKTWSNQVTGTQFSPLDILQWHYINPATIFKGSSNDTQSTGDALMARLFYSYNNRYMVTASVRRDGYSAFGRSNPHATFPAIALAWNFADENFLKWDILSLGKLRFSWGKNGNRSIGAYQALSELYGGTSGGYVYVDQNGNPVIYTGSLQVSRMANPNLKWESTASWNVGVDFGFLNNRISGSFEWYYMPTTDLLMDRTLPNITGFSSIKYNLGSIVNQGVEFSLTTHNIQRKQFDWTTTFTLSHNKNEIKHLYYTYEDIVDAQGNVIGTKEKDDSANGWFIGKPIGTIWDYQFTGIWQEDEKEEAAKYGQHPGDAKCLDVDNNYQYDDNDKVFMGNTVPKVRWSMRNDFRFFQNWDLSVNIYSYLGHKSTTTEYLNNFDAAGDYLNTYRRNYWTPENQSMQYARLKSTLPGGVEPKWVRKRNFIRLDNITLSYTLPTHWASMIKASNVNLYVNVNNVAVWAPDWEYWDPETGSLMPRTFTLGASVTF